MKITRFVAIALLCVTVSTAHAQRRRQFSAGQRFQSNGIFGLGLELGEPTGINAKLFLTPNHALDFGIGDIYHNYYVGGVGGVHIYADYLWHPFQLTETEDFKLPFYIGVGGRAWFFDYMTNGAGVVGFRVPIGLAFDLNSVPLDFFVEIVPTLDLYRNYPNRDLYLDIDFSIGARYWFS